jgi:hypothetical protein
LFGGDGGVDTVLLDRLNALNAAALAMYRQFEPTLRPWARVGYDGAKIAKIAS